MNMADITAEQIQAIGTAVGVVISALGAVFALLSRRSSKHNHEGISHTNRGLSEVRKDIAGVDTKLDNLSRNFDTHKTEVLLRLASAEREIEKLRESKHAPNNELTSAILALHKFIKARTPKEKEEES